MGDLVAAPATQLRRPASDPLQPAGARRAAGRSAARGSWVGMSAVEITDERVARGTSGPILGMVVFVASEAMFFATFFGAYFTIYSVNPVWPPAGFPRLEPGLATVLTVVLVSSSATLQLGVRAIRRDRPRILLSWLGLTILLGAAFLGLQLYDYSLLGFSVRDGIFGSLFYVMTGLHMAHVFGGVVF